MFAPACVTGMGLVAAALGAIVLLSEPASGPAPMRPEPETTTLRGTAPSQHPRSAVPGRRHDPPRDRGALLYEATRPDQVREMVRFCDTAEPADRAALLDVGLSSPDPLCVGNALRALGELDAVVGEPRLLALAGDARPRVRHELARALGSSRRPEAAAHLEQLLGHSDRKVRLLALQSLGRVGGPRAERVLHALDPDAASAEERAFTRAALGALEARSR